jgi:hypothetical protein
MTLKARMKEYGGPNNTGEEGKDIGEYEECQFCGALYEVANFDGNSVSMLNDHIKTTHNKVRVRKGSNYRWIDREEVLRKLGQQSGKAQ